MLWSAREAAPDWPPEVSAPCLPSRFSPQVPIYDFKESRRVGFRTVQVPESRVVILEGIYALSQRIRCVGL